MEHTLDYSDILSIATFSHIVVYSERWSNLLSEDDGNSSGVTRYFAKRCRAASFRTA